MGHDCKGLNGEVGVYVYSSRYSKLVKTYPVRSASAKEAADTLDKFCVGVLPFMGEPISCSVSKRMLVHSSCLENGQTYATYTKSGIGHVQLTTRP